MYKIVWSEFAENQLNNIFEYYSFTVSLETAKKIIYKIILSTEILIENPLVGRIEDLLINRKIQYRYLIQDNYKIIYSIKNDQIRIADNF